MIPMVSGNFLLVLSTMLYFMHLIWSLELLTYFPCIFLVALKNLLILIVLMRDGEVSLLADVIFLCFKYVNFLKLLF